MLKKKEEIIYLPPIDPPPPEEPPPPEKLPPPEYDEDAEPDYKLTLLHAIYALDAHCIY